MFWIIIGLGVCLVAPFIVLHFEAANQMEQDIALFLLECPTSSKPTTPSIKA